MYYYFSNNLVSLIYTKTKICLFSTSLRWLTIPRLPSYVDVIPVFPKPESVNFPYKLETNPHNNYLLKHPVLIKGLFNLITLNLTSYNINPGDCVVTV